MDIESARTSVTSNTTHDFGNFYGGAGTERAIWVGLIFDKVRYPILNVQDYLYETKEGLVYILTHECDLDQNNRRPFNEYALICPVIPFEDFHTAMSEVMNDSELGAFYGNIGKDNVSRLSYIPAITGTLPHGGVLYYNQITHTHIECLTGSAIRIESLTFTGLRIIDYKMSEHILRPKSEALSLMRY